MRGAQVTHKVSMGDCRCPGTPHDEDFAWVKDRLTFGDLRRIAWGFMQPEALAQAILLVQGIDWWNLVSEIRDGSGNVAGSIPLAVDIAGVDELDPDQAQYLIDEFSKPEYERQIRRGVGVPEPPPVVEAVANELPGEREGPTPNESGEPSPNGLAEPNSLSFETLTPVP